MLCREIPTSEVRQSKSSLLPLRCYLGARRGHCKSFVIRQLPRKCPVKIALRVARIEQIRAILGGRIPRLPFVANSFSVSHIATMHGMDCANTYWLSL